MPRTKPLSEDERAEGLREILLALYYAKSWRLAGDVARLIHRPANAVGLTMRCLATDGLLDSEWVTVERSGQKKRQRQYKLTAKGRQQAKRYVEEINVKDGCDPGERSGAGSEEAARDSADGS